MYVHFREPGLTRKGDMFTEAVRGGRRGNLLHGDAQHRAANDHHRDVGAKVRTGRLSIDGQLLILPWCHERQPLRVEKGDPKAVCGVKLFMGASTGNMLVDHARTLQAIFAEVDMLIAAHCEQEDIIRENIAV